MAYFELDPLKKTFERIVNKYLGDKLTGMARIDFITRLTILSHNIQSGNVSLEEAESYINDLLYAIFGDELDEETRQKVKDEIMVALRVMSFEGKLTIPKRRMLSY